jgi:heterodisulfide reductase subunit C
VEHIKEVAPRFGANYQGDGPGALRKIRQENLDEIRKIFEISGGIDLRNKVMENKE